MTEKLIERRFAVSRMEQNGRWFYVLSIPSDVLARCCFVSHRDKDETEGFQRNLDEKKAKSIATYMETGNNTMPTSIILSAQPEAKIEVDRRKTLVFFENPKAFLVLDGQHRVYAYRFLKKSFRIPVVIYDCLSRQEEARLFIDINTKQTPVPSALILDIKKLANADTNSERYLGGVFDLFYSEMNSCLIGRLSKTGSKKGLLNRMNFNRAFKPLLKAGIIDPGSKSEQEIFEIFNNYFQALLSQDNLDLDQNLTKSNVFYSFVEIFPKILNKKIEGDYSFSSFESSIKSIFTNLRSSKFLKNTTSIKKITEILTKEIDQSISL